MFTTGDGGWSPHRTTIRLLTMLAVRSSSSDDHAALVQAAERHLDHADGTFDDPRASGHDGVGLLAAQHRLRDLLGVGQVGDADLDDLEPGDGDPLGHLDGQLAGDDVGGAAQRRPGPGGVVVGVARPRRGAGRTRPAPK